MESMESIRAEQPAINHRVIAYAQAAFMYVRQQAVIRGHTSVFMSATEGRAGKGCKNRRYRAKRQIYEVSKRQI